VGTFAVAFDDVNALLKRSLSDAMAVTELKKQQEHQPSANLSSDSAALLRARNESLPPKNAFLSCDMTVTEFLVDFVSCLFSTLPYFLRLFFRHFQFHNYLNPEME